MKRLNDFYKKYEGVIKLILFALPLLFAMYKYLASYIDVPKNQEIMSGQIEYLIKKAKQDSTYNEEDYRSIKAINEKLERNNIR